MYLLIFWLSVVTSLGRPGLVPAGPGLPRLKERRDLDLGIGGGAIHIPPYLSYLSLSRRDRRYHASPVKLMAHALSPSQLSIAKWSALIYLAVFVLQFYSLFLLSSSIQHSVCSATYIPIPRKGPFFSFISSA